MFSSWENALSDACLRMNLGKYPVILRKLFAASFDSGELLLFTASIFSELESDPFLMKRFSYSSISSIPNWHFCIGCKTKICSPLPDYFVLEGLVPSAGCWLRFFGIFPSIRCMASSKSSHWVLKVATFPDSGPITSWGIPVSFQVWRKQDSHKFVLKKLQEELLGFSCVWSTLALIMWCTRSSLSLPLIQVLTEPQAVNTMSPIYFPSGTSSNISYEVFAFSFTKSRTCWNYFEALFSLFCTHSSWRFALRIGQTSLITFWNHCTEILFKALRIISPEDNCVSWRNKWYSGLVHWLCSCTVGLSRWIDE